MTGSLASTPARLLAIVAGTCALVGSLVGLLVVGGCGRTSITDPLASVIAAPEGVELDEIEFWHVLPTRTVVANGDALLGLIFLATGGSASAGDTPLADLVGADYDERVAYAKRRGWLSDDYHEPADLAVRRGVVARALADICRVHGGVMMQLLGSTERYSARELEYMGIMPSGSPNQVVAGGEFIGLISQAQDYINFKRLEPLPGVRATLSPPTRPIGELPPPPPSPAGESEPARPGSGAGDETDVASTARAGDVPIVLVVFDAGMPGDPGSRSSGVRLAVWEDGTALIASDPLHPGRDVRVGLLSPEQMAGALGELDRAGFFTQPDTVLVAPDSAWVRVTARSNGVTRTHALDSHHQSRGAWWPHVSIALEQLRPGDTRPIADAATDGEFRGYVLAEWQRTPWVK